MAHKNINIGNQHKLAFGTRIEGIEKSIWRDVLKFIHEAPNKYLVDAIGKNL